MARSQEIFSAIVGGDAEAVRRILDDDPGLVDCRQRDSEHPLTCLQLAAELGNLPVCRLLVERKAEVYPNPLATYPPVVLADWKGHKTVVKFFLREIPDLAQGTNGLGVACNLAARQGWTDIVREHLACDPLAAHQRGWIGDTPLHWPAHNGYVEIVAMLLDAGADVEADEINWIGGKPLHWAAEHEPATTRLLLERGANVNSRNELAKSPCFGRTPLMHNAAQRNDCSEATELLLNSGADVTATDPAGQTALTIARAKGNRHIEKVLLAHGAI